MLKFWPIVAAGLLGLAALLASLHADGDAAQAYRLGARYTARAGFPFLMITYVASSLVVLRPSSWTRALLANRKYWGLAFAASHTVHLVALLGFLGALPQWPPLIGLAPGFAGYVMLYAMAFTSNGRAYRALGPNWKKLHAAGIHILWLIMVVTYLGKLADPGQMATGGFFAAIALMALLIRIGALRKKRAIKARS